MPRLRFPVPPGVQGRCLLGIFAHPDDESWGMGGTLVKYSSQGVYVALLCATRGEAGEIADPSLATREELGQVRAGELRRAARVLGVRHLRFLGVIDGQAQYWDIERTREQVVRAIRELRPQVVVTFGPDGATGHQDHIMTFRLATEAFILASDLTRYPHHLDQLGLQAHQPQRLYYCAGMPEKTYPQMEEGLKALGVSPDEFLDDFKDFIVPDGAVSAAVDVSSAVEKKLKALRCHRTQLPPGNILEQLPAPALRVLFQREFFYQAHPKVQPPVPYTDDLFEGVVEPFTPEKG
ncbi:MAG: PIG-L family deacetylase [Chloroflexi bacterium]|nr:PIG-L family deacetylase [Chloroflexota bacterium]